jgi:hypothetical protein
MLEAIMRNFVVQILLGIGGMVMLIMLGEAIRNIAHRKPGTDKAAESRIRADVQKELVSMRSEVDQLRSILVEHSMSLDNNVETLSRRVAHLEQRISSQESQRHG